MGGYSLSLRFGRSDGISPEIAQVLVNPDLFGSFYSEWTDYTQNPDLLQLGEVLVFQMPYQCEPCTEFVPDMGPGNLVKLCDVILYSDVAPTETKRVHVRRLSLGPSKYGMNSNATYMLSCPMKKGEMVLYEPSFPPEDTPALGTTGVIVLCSIVPIAGFLALRRRRRIRKQ